MGRIGIAAKTVKISQKTKSRAVTLKKRREIAQTKEKKGPTTTKTVTEGEMAEIARDVENHRTLENNAQQEIPTAISAGHQGTGHESAREKGRTTTTTTEGGDNTIATMAITTTVTMAIITMATTDTITIATMATIIIATMATTAMVTMATITTTTTEMANTTTGQVEVVAHHHTIQGHTTNNQ